MASSVVSFEETVVILNLHVKALASLEQRMSMRSRKKKIFWGVASRRSPKKLLRKLRFGNSSKNWNSIASSVIRVFGGDLLIAWDWFNYPGIALDGARPLDLVAEGNIESLRDHLIRLEYGVYI